LNPQGLREFFRKDPSGIAAGWQAESGTDPQTGAPGLPARRRRSASPNGISMLQIRDLPEFGDADLRRLGISPGLRYSRTNSLPNLNVADKHAGFARWSAEEGW